MAPDDPRIAQGGFHVRFVRRGTLGLIVDGDQAAGVFYHISRHRLPNRFGDDHYTQYGWYENSFRRTAEGWKISRLKHTFQWCDGNPTLIDASDPAWAEAAAAVFRAG